MERTPRPRLLLIALDALPAQLLDAWCHDGSLPNLRALRARGIHGGVESDAERFPGAVWPTFFTRRDVSHHGIYHYLQWDPESLRLRAPGPVWLPAVPFWHHLAQAGVPVIALDVPFAATASGPPGAIEVVGWGTREGAWETSRPPGLRGELRRRHGRTSLTPEVAGPRPEADLVRDLEGLIADVERRVRVIEDLAGRFAWRLLIACFPETHQAGHWFWGARVTGQPRGGLLAVARAFDRALPRLRALLGPDDFIAVFSLHGMGPRHDLAAFGPALASHLNPSVGAARRRADATLALRRLLPVGYGRRLLAALPQPFYWRLTETYANARLRWSPGGVIVNPLDQLLYASLAPAATGEDDRQGRLERLRQEMDGLRTRDGRGLVDAILEPRESYSGPRLPLLPDLVVRGTDLDPGEDALARDGYVLRGRKSSWQDGDHRSDGFYVLAGPSVAPARGPLVRVEDLARVLCAPAGLALPADA